MTSVGIVLLAGGASSRMLGPDKVLEQVRGMPLLTDRAQMCLATQAEHTVVVTAPDKPDRRLALGACDVEIAVNGGSAQGMSHSLQVGLRRIRQDAVLVMLADLPDLTSDDLDAVISAAQTSDAPILRGASQSGRPGHPVLIKRVLFPMFDALKGDQGASSILAAHRETIELVPLPDDHAIADLDTPEAWAQWRSSN